jgi:RND family efflux transporter MFP subunit
VIHSHSTFESTAISSFERVRRISTTVAVLCCAAISGCQKHAAPPSDLPEVVTAPVVTRPITEWDEYTGRFEAVDSVEVRPRASGYIDEVKFREGQFVTKDQVLVVIDPRPYQADLDRARAGLDLARSQYELANLEALRAQKLKDSGAVSREELDQRLSLRNQQQANIAAAAAALDSAQLLLSFTQVRAPVDGRVGRAEVTRGNLVTGGNSGGTLLTTIVSVDPIYVYFDGDENAYLKYNALARAGQRSSSRDVRNPVHVGLADEAGFPHTGYVDFVDNQLDRRTGTIRARAVLDNKAGLFTPGLFARVQLLGSGEHEAVLVEDRAIGTDQNHRYVLALGADSKLEYRAVQLGPVIDGLRVVRNGLNTGDVIVVSGLQRVRPGMQVKPKPTTMGQPSETVSAAG